MDESAPSPGRSPTISRDDVCVRIGGAKFGANWIGKLTDRECGLIERRYRAVARSG